MKHRSASRVGLCLGAVLALGIAGGAAAGKTGGAPASESKGAKGFVVSWSFPDGTLKTILPLDWESNGKLAQENEVQAFVHPGGMKVGDALPSWLLVERRARAGTLPFADEVHSILREGKDYGFTPRDSTTITTADGRRLMDYTFQPAADGAERGLAFLESPAGILLFRYSAVSAEAWKNAEPGFETILHGLQFLPEASKGKS